MATTSKRGCPELRRRWLAPTDQLGYSTRCHRGSAAGLLDDLCTRLRIPRHRVIGHADMAPVRKSDPGARFPWATLAAAGFGLWPAADAPAAPAAFDPMLALRLLGNPLDDAPAAIRAFHRHYRGIDSDSGVLDAQILFALQRLKTGAHGNYRSAAARRRTACPGWRVHSDASIANSCPGILAGSSHSQVPDAVD